MDKINVTDLETEASNQAKEKAKNAVNTAISETEASTKKDVMDRLKETESYKSLTSEQQEELEKAVNTASGTSSSAEKECDSMNISLTNASGAKTAIDQAVNALAEVKAMQVDTTTAQKALADLVTQFTALSNSLSDMPGYGRNRRQTPVSHQPACPGGGYTQHRNKPVKLRWYTA